MRVALVCPTVGETRRGYERFVTELFELLRPEVDVTLFKGAGERREREVVVPHVRRDGWLARLMLQRGKYLRYRLEYSTFAAALWPHLARGDFDLVHFIDPAMRAPLARMRRLGGYRYRLLFTCGCPIDAGEAADHYHCVAPAGREQALEAGIPAERLSMIPVGVALRKLAAPRERGALRRKHGIAEGTFVVLAVTTFNRHHKRVDHLIEEVAKMEGDVLLWMDGSVHPDGDPALIELARQRLGQRLRHTHVESDRLAELYDLADVLVSAATDEAFGMAIVEASCAGLPVVVHDAPHFRWLLNGQGNLVDMRAPGALAARLAELRDRRHEPGDPGAGESVRRRFGWDFLREAYLDLYRRAAAPERIASGHGAGPEAILMSSQPRKA